MLKRRLLVAACGLILVAGALFSGVGTGTARAGGTVFFIDAQNGWQSTIDQTYDIGMAKGTAWHTVNGGASWKCQATRACAFDAGAAWGGFFAFATRNTGIWVRASHTVLRTTNAGASWHSVGWVAKTWLNDATFATSRVGWACSQIGSAAAGGSIVRTADAGRTWRVQKRIVGHDNIGAFQQVSCPTARSCYVLGSGSKLGGLWATADGGKHWARRQLPGGVYWTSIDFPTASTGWAVGWNGSGGDMVKTTNGGRTWSYEAGDTGEVPRSVSFCNSHVGYTVGASGMVWRTTNGGAKWNHLDGPDPNGSDFSEVTCVDATHTWIIDTYGNTYVSADGGNTWNWNSVYPPSSETASDAQTAP